MSFFSKLFGTETDPKEAMRPLWHAVVGEARDPVWYRDCLASDTVEGRFDMIANVTAMVILRMRQDPELTVPSALLTRLFSEDMEGQLRETGLGDPTLGKKMSKLMESLAGRIGAYRDAADAEGDAMARAVGRNSRLRDDAPPDLLAKRLTALAARLVATSVDDLLSGKIST